MLFDLDWKSCESKVLPGVSYKIRPLKTWAFQKLMAFWADAGADDSGKINITATKGLELMGVGQDIFPDHLKEIENLTVKIDGKERPVVPADLWDESAFVALAGEIMGELASISQVGAEEEKNSERLPPKSSGA